jgi:hypothetical protein
MLGRVIRPPSRASIDSPDMEERSGCGVVGSALLWCAADLVGAWVLFFALVGVLAVLGQLLG